MKTKSIIFLIILLNSLLLQYSCIKKEILSLPVVSTGGVYNIGLDSAKAKGNIEELGTEEGVIQHGHVWSKENTSPTIEDEKSSLGPKLSAGEFASDITGLDSGAVYYLRSYAINENGLFYGNEVSFLTEEATSGMFTDIRDNNIYEWVKIGNQIWMAENLAYLPSVSKFEYLHYINDLGESHYYVYDYYDTIVSSAKATSNYETYGVLYNWDAAMDGAFSSSSNPSGVQGACPDDWHLPSDAEWTELTDYIASDGYSGTEGIALKSTFGWNENRNGLDNYGISFFPW